jgi:hypothetical protein
MRALIHLSTTKGKAVPLQACSDPEGSRKLRFPDFLTTAQDGGEVVSLTHRPYLSPFRSRRQRMDIGKYSLLNRTIQHWKQLPAEVLETLPCITVTFKRRVRKVIIEVS